MSKENAQGQNKETTIVVNTNDHNVLGPTITFEEVVEFAYPGTNYNYTITYSGGMGGKDGALYPGKKVPVEEGMEFDVTPSNKS